jgi:Lipopolysaccharide-assembly
VKSYKIIFVMALISICGCMGYKAGTLLPGHVKTVSVPIFKNSSGEPNIETTATNAVINKINIDGTLKTVDKEADSLLKCTIIGFKRRPLRYGSGRPDEYRIIVTAEATFTDLTQNRPFWSQKKITGKADFLVQGNLPASEREALPLALEDLARNIVEQVVEGWE